MQTLFQPIGHAKSDRNRTEANGTLPRPPLPCPISEKIFPKYAGISAQCHKMVQNAAKNSVTFAAFLPGLPNPRCKMQPTPGDGNRTKATEPDIPRSTRNLKPAPVLD
jgi:hypothetical protein